MAPTTKYSAVPQRDSTDSTAYTGAPPPYADPTTADTDEATLLRGPRSYEDNIPDDFKACKLFGAIGFMCLTYWKRKSYPFNLFFLAGFTAFEAYSVALVTSFYDTRIVLQAVILTTGIFIALTLFACQTKYDFTSWMPYLFGGLWGLIMFGFMASFFPGKTTDLIYGGISALVFSAYILVDTQLIMRHHHVEEEIAASISLYLDVINLFLSILRILNSQQNNQ
ncbi:hypothetical protein BGT96224_895 [Blumeria graminis f. sp. tritici 96224]|nr:hypothetical protein BGT96224_895 [Blumeria graminis f. sp. tritici 96224]